MRENEAVVHYDSAEAARYVRNIDGWVSRKGQFYGNHKGAENLARWDGCTHVKCEGCGATTERSYSLCKTCRAAREVERFKALPVRDWDGLSPVCVYRSDAFFFGWDALEEHCEEEGESPEGMMLVHCAPRIPRLIDIADWLSDYVPDDDDDAEHCIPRAVFEAADALNAAIRAAGPWSWRPIDVAVGGENWRRFVEGFAARVEAEVGRED